MSLEKLFEDSFSDILTHGAHTREVRLSKNLTITMVPLTEKDIMAVKLAIPANAKTDVLTYQSVESFEKVSRAVIEINGVSILETARKELGDSDVVKAEVLALNSTRQYLGKLSPKMLNYISREYNDMVRDQYEALKSDLGDDIENF